MIIIRLILSLLVVMTPYSFAVDVKLKQQLSQHLSELFEAPASAIRIHKAELPGFKIFQIDNAFGLISDDAKYLIQGNVINLHKRQDIVAEIRQANTLQLLGEIDPSNAVSFKARAQKAAIAVFSDLDCHFCQKLHQEVPELNKLGVTVNYYAYPRSGNATASDWQRAQKVWCAKQPLQAMNLAKRPASVAKVQQRADCQVNIAKQYALGASIGVRGTPTIVLQNGEIIGGYRPASMLAEAAISATRSK